MDGDIILWTPIVIMLVSILVWVWYWISRSDKKFKELSNLWYTQSLLMPDGRLVIFQFGIFGRVYIASERYKKHTLNFINQWLPIVLLAFLIISAETDYRGDGDSLLGGWQYWKYMLPVLLFLAGYEILYFYRNGWRKHCERADRVLTLAAKARYATILKPVMIMMWFMGVFLTFLFVLPAFLLMIWDPRSLFGGEAVFGLLFLGLLLYPPAFIIYSFKIERDYNN